MTPEQKARMEICAIRSCGFGSYINEKDFSIFKLGYTKALESDEVKELVEAATAVLNGSYRGGEDGCHRVQEIHLLKIKSALNKFYGRDKK